MTDRSTQIARLAGIASCALLGACGLKPEAPLTGPAAAAMRFSEAAVATRCGEMWQLYSSATQQNIRARVHRGERERDGLPRPEGPEEMYCLGYMGHELKRGSARTLREDGDEALVAVDFIVKAPRHRWDIYFPPSVVKTVELRLVREDGAWRVEREVVPSGRTSAGVIEVGPVDVFHEAAPRGLLDRIEATTVMPVPRARLDPALRDASRWARALPGVAAVESLNPSGERSRVRVDFASPERSLMLDQKNDLTDADPADVLMVRFQADQKAGESVYLRGSWALDPNSDGSTRVTLVFFFFASQWPNAATDFSAERVAAAVLSLDDAASPAAR